MSEARRKRKRPSAVKDGPLITEGLVAIHRRPGRNCVRRRLKRSEPSRSRTVRRGTSSRPALRVAMAPSVGEAASRVKLPTTGASTRWVAGRSRGVSSRASSWENWSKSVPMVRPYTRLKRSVTARGERMDSPCSSTSSHSLSSPYRSASQSMK